MRYLLVIEEGETSFGAYYPDVLGCVAAAESFGEAVKLGREALEFHLEEESEPPPERSLLELIADGEVNDLDCRALVWVDYEPDSNPTEKSK